MEQARDMLYASHIEAELHYPGELDKFQNGATWYGFSYDDGDGQYRYVWVNSKTGAVEFADEIINYTGGEVMTMEQARDYLYANHVEAELHYPGELDKWQDGATWYGFSYDDGGGNYRYVWINSTNNAVEFADEIINYTGGEVMTMEQARDYLYANHVDAELHYPGELDKWQDGATWYGFSFEDNGEYRYVWINSTNNAVEFADEVENYTGEN